MYDSYGLIACQLARHVERLGVTANAIGLGKRHMDTQPDDIKRITARPLQPSVGGILLGYPTSYNKFSPLSMVGPRVAVTMFESDMIPDEWVTVLNQVDAVVTPSTFCKNVFAGCGVTTPIHVVPLGINHIYQPAMRPSNRKPMTFLAFMDRGRRKGGWVAQEAFLKAFGDNTNYWLLLKTRRAKDFTVNALNENIDFVQKDMSEEELYGFYLQADVLINPNLGEGFGLIPREFAATGGIALATDWGGTADDIKEWGIPISADEQPAWVGHRHEGLGNWADPNVEDLAYTLKEIALNRAYYLEFARYKALWVRRMYTWDRFAKGVLRVWNEVLNGYTGTDRQASARHRRNSKQPVRQRSR